VVTCAVIAYNLTRAAAALTGAPLGKARTGSIRATLINIPARIAYSARIHTLHLPARSRRETLFNNHVHRCHGATPSRLTPCAYHPRPDPAPPGHPDHRSGHQPLPATGFKRNKINYAIPRSTTPVAVDQG